ncbi:hypothetical protein Ancab_012985 [Ancistrocladus abbreviatus]
MDGELVNGGDGGEAMEKWYQYIYDDATITQAMRQAKIFIKPQQQNAEDLDHKYRENIEKLALGVANYKNTDEKEQSKQANSSKKPASYKRNCDQ